MVCSQFPPMAPGAGPLCLLPSTLPSPGWSGWQNPPPPPNAPEPYKCLVGDGGRQQALSSASCTICSKYFHFSFLRKPGPHCMWQSTDFLFHPLASPCCSLRLPGVIPGCRTQERGRSRWQTQHPGGFLSQLLYSSFLVIRLWQLISWQQLQGGIQLLKLWASLLVKYCLPKREVCGI